MSLKAQVKKLPLPAKDFFISEEIPDSAFVHAFNRKLLDLTCRDVLNVRWNKHLKRKLHESIENLSLRARGPRAVSGVSKEQVHFESTLAKHLNKESVFIFTSKTQALISLVTSFALETDRLITFSGSGIPVEDLSLIAGCRSLEIGLLEELSDSFGRDFYFYKLDHEIGDRIASGKSQIKIENIYIKTGGAPLLKPPSPLISFDTFLIGSFEEVGFSSCCFISGESDLIEYLKSRTGTVNTDSPLPSYLFSFLDDAMSYVSSDSEAKNLVAEKTSLLLSTLKLSLPDCPMREESFSVKIPIPSFASAVSIRSGLIKRGYLVELRQHCVGRRVFAEIVVRLNSLISEEQILSFSEVFMKEYLSQESASH